MYSNPSQIYEMNFFSVCGAFIYGLLAKPHEPPIRFLATKLNSRLHIPVNFKTALGRLVSAPRQPINIALETMPTKYERAIIPFVTYSLIFCVFDYCVIF